MNFADSQSVMEGKALMLKAHAKTLQAENPGWSFGRAWSRALELHPDLAENHGDEEGLSPTSMPAYTPPLPGQVAADQVKLDALLKKYMSGSRRIEAKKPREEEGIERVEAIEPVGANPILVRGIDVGMISRIG